MVAEEVVASLYIFNFFTIAELGSAGNWGRERIYYLHALKKFKNSIKINSSGDRSSSLKMSKSLIV